MTDQLISLETAILAKEKGYNQNPYKTKNAYGPEFMDGSNVRLRSSSLFNPGSNTAVAPTQSLLQKWLREIHSMHPIVLPTMDFKHWTLNYDIYKFYNSYEEALEAGLLEALKLIK